MGWIWCGGLKSVRRDCGSLFFNFAHVVATLAACSAIRLEE
jgi:hypothetical protein